MARSDQVQAAIGLLNSIQVGELSAIDGKLRGASEQVGRLGESELAQVIEEARVSIGKGDLPTFRRLVAQAVARLGHLR